MDEHKTLILNIVNNRAFGSLFDSMKLDIALRILEIEDLGVIANLKAEAKALDRVQEKLVTVANEVRMGAK